MGERTPRRCRARGRSRAVIDTESASLGIALLALAVQRRLDQGTTDAELDELVTAFRRDVGLVFTVDTLEFLARGGRIGRAQAWAGELLAIKPILRSAMERSSRSSASVGIARRSPSS